MNNLSKMQISIVVGILLVGGLAAFSADAKSTAIVSILAGFAIGYFFAKVQMENIKKGK